MTLAGGLPTRRHRNVDDRIDVSRRVLDSVSESLRVELQAASGDLLAALRENDAQADDPHELSERLDWLVHALDGRADVPPRELPRNDRTLSCSLLRRLRAEIVDRWSRAATPPPAGELLSLFQAFERVEEALDSPPDHSVPASAARGTRAFDLITELAHDLRSPLTSILFLAETLWRGQSGELADIQHRQVGLIYSAALGLIGLIGDMIEYAHGGDVLADAEPEIFSVTEVFESVSRIVQPSAEERSLRLRTSPPEEDRRRGHRVPLSRVLLNLTQNALKFTEEGFVEIVARPVADDRIEFSVRDTGPGIDDDALDTLYEPLKRSEARDSGYFFSETALGLSICRKLVGAMGSELRLETRADWGTRFYFEADLPIAGHG